MRVTVVQGPFLPVPPLLGGAVEKIMDALTRAWAARGHQVTLVSRRFPGLADSESRDGVRHLRVASRDGPAGRLAFRLAELRYGLRVRRVLPAGDILLTNSVLLPPLLRDRSRGLLYVRLGRQPKGQLRLYRHAARLQALSEAQAARMRAEAPALAARVAVIGSPLPEAFAPCPPESLEAERPPLLLYAGRIAPEKGLELLLEGFAAARLPADWRLAVAGPWQVRAGGGGADYLARLQALAAPLGARVAFLGPIFDQPALAALYRSARLFLYPSLAEQGETFGLAVLEAMAQGAVPLVSDLAVFRGLVQAGETGAVFDHRGPRAPAALAAALERLAPDGALRRRLSAGAHALASAHRLEAVAERYLEDFSRLLAAEP